MTIPLLEVNRINKRFGTTVALDDISLSVQRGEIVCLLGPSGCGKTTLLRLIAGLETVDRGEILFDGKDMTNVPVHQRGFGFMFQDYALFPHKNVAENVAFGLRMNKLAPQEIATHVREGLALVGLAGKEERPVNALSGGEQQRVALARSLAPSPHLLLLDEPLGSLDRALRERLMNELRTILKRVHMTAITVTHDQQEAFALADKIVVMKAGRALQVAPPEVVYRQPSSPAVADFLGLTNLIEGTLVNGDPIVAETALGRITVSTRPDAEQTFKPGDPVTVLLRPEAASTCQLEEQIPLGGRLVNRSFRGSHYQITVACPGAPLLSFALRAAPEELSPPGEMIQLFLDPAAISVLPRSTTKKNYP